ncbi:MAG: hypothetical protein D6732_03000 [Methanobacteriota archaeon]|nr:MAG: hypothetical protein D6732_03000 [Euryarchaeota archaeon]
MWVEVTLSDPLTGTVYFRTGSLDPNGDLLNYHSEYVANGTLPEDSLLVLFNGTPIDENGEETPFFWRAASVVNRTIPAFQSRTANYYLFAPQTTTPLRLTVRLRFRSFPPYLFRAIGMDDLIDELIIFDMETYEQTINITS